MTSLINAVAMFCEDIREEVSGQHSIIGVFSDTLRVTSIPGAMPKLGVYVRMHIDVTCDPSEFTIVLIDAENNTIGTSSFERDLVAKTLEDAKVSGKKVAGFFSQMVGIQVPIKKMGPVECYLQYEKETRFLGALNFELEETGKLEN